MELFNNPSYQFSLVLQLSELSREWHVFPWFEQGIDEIFQEFCKKENFSCDTSPSFDSKLLLLQQYISQKEEEGKTEELSFFFEGLKKFLQQIKEEKSFLFSLLWFHKSLVDEILHEK